MTDFERAVVAAFLARREPGEDSWTYRMALLEMERQRPLEMPPPRPKARP